MKDYEIYKKPNIEEGKVKLHVNTATFIVGGKEKSYYVTLFPKRKCNCNTGQFGDKVRACIHITAALKSINFRDESTKKPKLKKTGKKSEKYREVITFYI